MKTKQCITFLILLCLSVTPGVALATTYQINWYNEAQCPDASKCSCKEVSGYTKGSESLKKTIAPLAYETWSSMTITNTNLNPLSTCTMVLTATNCSYYACKDTSPTTQQCGYWTDSKTVELPCNKGKAYVDYYSNGGFQINFQKD